MNNKKAKKLRKQLKIKVSPKDGYQADYRVLKEVETIAYFDKVDILPGGRQVKTGEKVAVKCKRQTIANAAKYGYRKVKKDYQKLNRRERR